MADNTVKRPDMKNTNAVFQKILLKTVKYAPVFEQKGVVLNAKITGSDYVSWFRVNRIAASDNPTELSDGVNPSETAVTTDKFTGTISWYGIFAKVASAAKKIDPVMIVSGFTKAIGEHARETREIIIRNEFIGSGASIAYANAVNTIGDVVATISETDLKKLFRTMEKAGAEKITKIVKGTAAENTHPVEACYLLYVSPDQAMDVRGLTNFTKVADYSNPDIAFEGEIGNDCGFRIISTNFLTGVVGAGLGSGTTTGKQYTSAHCDVHTAIAVGAEVIGVADLDGGIENIIKDEKEIGGALEQFSTTGYKMGMCAETLNSSWIALYKTAVSA